MSKENGTGAFLTGFFVGGLVGAAAALLMTPQSGETTRLQLQERGIELKGHFGDVATEIQERGKAVVETKLPRRGEKTSDEETEAPAGESDEAITDEEAS